VESIDKRLELIANVSAFFRFAPTIPVFC